MTIWAMVIFIKLWKKKHMLTKNSVDAVAGKELDVIFDSLGVDVPVKILSICRECTLKRCARGK